MTADHITLTGIEVYAHHGVHQSERDFGQRFIVDVDLALDLRPAGTSDDLNATVDYGTVARMVQRILKSSPVNLLETLAERICAEVLQDDRVHEVSVTVHKPQAPLTVTFADVSVTLVRRRP